MDVSRAGEGQLEITVDHGSVPNNARPIDKDQFAVAFTPREARPHVVQITFNGEQCKCQSLRCCLSLSVFAVVPCSFQLITSGLVARSFHFNLSDIEIISRYALLHFEHVMLYVY